MGRERRTERVRKNAEGEREEGRGRAITDPGLESSALRRPPSLAECGWFASRPPRGSRCDTSCSRASLRVAQQILFIIYHLFIYLLAGIPARGTVDSFYYLFICLFICSRASLRVAQQIREE